MTTDHLYIPAAVEWACERELLYVRLSGALDELITSALLEDLSATDPAATRRAPSGVSRRASTAGPA
jgi:hypothetical protein